MKFELFDLDKPTLIAMMTPYENSALSLFPSMDMAADAILGRLNPQWVRDVIAEYDGDPWTEHGMEDPGHQYLHYVVWEMGLNPHGQSPSSDFTIIGNWAIRMISDYINNNLGGNTVVVVSS